MRTITSIRVWHKVWPGGKKEARVYINFGRKDSGCFYQTGNPYQAPHTLENLTMDELREAIRLAGVNGRWQTLYEGELEARRRELDAPAEQPVEQEEAVEVEQKEIAGPVEQPVQKAAPAPQKFNSDDFFGVQGSCAECGKDCDPDHSLCPACLGKPREPRVDRLAVQASLRRYHSDNASNADLNLLVKAGLARHVYDDPQSNRPTGIQLIRSGHTTEPAH